MLSWQLAAFNDSSSSIACEVFFKFKYSNQRENSQSRTNLNLLLGRDAAALVAFCLSVTGKVWAAGGDVCETLPLE